MKINFTIPDPTPINVEIKRDWFTGSFKLHREWQGVRNKKSVGIGHSLFGCDETRLHSECGRPHYRDRAQPSSLLRRTATAAIHRESRWEVGGGSDRILIAVQVIRVFFMN
jgi:hypothetical protein